MLFGSTNEVSLGAWLSIYLTNDDRGRGFLWETCLKKSLFSFFHVVALLVISSFLSPLFSPSHCFCASLHYEFIFCSSFLSVNEQCCYMNFVTHCDTKKYLYTCKYLQIRKHNIKFPATRFTKRS